MQDLYHQHSVGFRVVPRTKYEIWKRMAFLKLSQPHCVKGFIRDPYTMA